MSLTKVGKLTRRLKAAADPQFQLVPRTTHNYLKTLLESTLCDVYATALRLNLGKSGLRTAYLGSDPDLLTNAESFNDYGLIYSGCFDEKPKDNSFHPMLPLSELTASQFDCLIVGAKTVDEEQQLLKALGAVMQSDGECPVLRISWLCSSLYDGLGRINATLFFTCLNPRKLALVALALAASPGGAILECGAFRGGTSILMATLLQVWGDPRMVYMLDTFEGMPQPTTSDGSTIYQEGTFTDTGYEIVKGYVTAHGLDSRIKLCKGLVQDTLPAVWQREDSVGLALVDTDQYAGTIASLREILPRLRKNGIILIDDYSLQGVQQAIEEMKQDYPKLGGALVTYNLYMLWHETDGGFLSQWRKASRREA